MNTPTKLLSQHLIGIAEYVDSEEELAVTFTNYFKKSIDLMEAYEKHIAMDAYLEGANVGREMMKSWMQNKESDLQAFEEFKKYWANKQQSKDLLNETK